MAVPTVPGLVGNPNSGSILSRTAGNFLSYQHPTVEKVLQAKSELPRRRDVVWSVVVLLVALLALLLSFTGRSLVVLVRSRAVSELLQVLGWQGVDEGLLILAIRTALALLSLIYSASLYFFLKLHITANAFAAPATPRPKKTPSTPANKKPAPLSSTQLALLFPTQPTKALAKIPEIVQTVKQTPSEASHLAASILKKTKIVLHDAASSATRRLRGSTTTDTAPPKSDPEPQSQPPSAKPASAAPLLAPIHAEIQKAISGSSMALWGSGGKALTNGLTPGGVALPGRTTPAFSQTSFVPSSPFSPIPFTKQSPPPVQSPVPQYQGSGVAGGGITGRGFTPLQSEEALDNFLADLDRRMETPKPQSPSFGASPDTGVLPRPEGGSSSPFSPAAESGYFAQQGDHTGKATGIGMYPQSPIAQNAASPLFGSPAQTPLSPTRNEQQGIGPQNSPYSPPNLSQSPAPYAPSAPPLSQLPQQSPISSPAPYGSATPAPPTVDYMQPTYQAQQSQTPSPYRAGGAAYNSPVPSAYGSGTAAYGSPMPSAVSPSPAAYDSPVTSVYGPYSSPYNQSPGPAVKSQYTISPQPLAPYPAASPGAYTQSSNLLGSPYGISSYPPAAPPPLQGGQVAPGNSPLPPSGRPFIRSSPSQPKPGVLTGVKADRELPGPMPPEVLERRLKGLGVLPGDLDAWRDDLRVWFAEKLLGPLVKKIDDNPAKVQTACSALNISLPVSLTPPGTDSQPVEVSAATLGLQAAPSEEQVLKLLGEKLQEERKKAMQPPPAAPTSIFGQAQAQQQGPSLPSIQACLDAVTENQRLRLLLRGELAPRVLPVPAVPPAFTARRIRELAEGACVKCYDWSGGGDVIPGQQTWAPGANLPGDAHLLFYLFTAFLEFPGWSLHQEPVTGPGHQGGFFFVGDLPKRLPEQFVAILQPPLTSELRAAVRQPKATVVLVGKQSPTPVFYLLWGGKFQFVLQGRTAVWDTVALLTYRLRQSHGGAIRGISLDSSTVDLPPAIRPM